MPRPDLRARSAGTPAALGTTLLAAAAACTASTSANYSIDPIAFGGAGGHATSANYSAFSVIEGFVAGTASSSDYQARYGFLPSSGPSHVTGRFVFYNQSAWDGNNAAANAADDGAIATDKTALLPGGVATFANYTSYSLGLNGLMVDLPLGGTPTASDFEFRTGNNNTPAGWAAASAPTTIAVRPGAGVGGADRVSLIWNTASAVKKLWLQVKVLATANTGLAIPDTFYFGNAIGETGNDPLNARVSTADVILIRNNPKTLLDPAPLTFPYDINRDKRVSAQDTILARNNLTTFLNELKLINLGGGGDGPALAGFEPANEESLRAIAHPSALAMGWIEGQAALSFQGPPGTDYVVLASTSVEGDWVAVEDRVVEVSPGRFQFRHLSAPDKTCFYKIVAVAVETEAEATELPTH